MAKKGSKNNIANRGEAARVKLYENQQVEPVELIISGKSRFIAAQFIESKKLVKDSNNKYIAYGAIQ